MNNDERISSDERIVVEQLEVVINRLPLELRQIFVMRYVQQKPFKKIAAQLRISTYAAEERATEALAQCRRGVAPYITDEMVQSIQPNGLGGE